MSNRDDEAAAFYDIPAHRELGDAAHKPVAKRRLSNHVPIRFAAATIELVKRIAADDGITVSAWIRAVVEREVRWRLARETYTTHDLAPLSFEMLEGPPADSETLASAQLPVLAN
ncbi:MAG: hypothetical protein L0Y54_03330 [Sporichthyaceae bacterium]|nr:hypothetical protein [Sporichthyaceae bacterium]